MDRDQLFRVVADAAAKKGYSIQSFCSQELGCSKPTLRKVLDDPENSSHAEKVNVIRNILDLDVIATRAKGSPVYINQPPISPDHQQLLEKIAQLESDNARLAEENSTLSQELINASDPGTLLETMFEGKVILQFPEEKKSQVDYINAEIIPQAMEAGIISYPGELLVKLLSYVQGGWSIDKPGFIPRSGKTITEV